MIHSHIIRRALIARGDDHFLLPEMPGLMVVYSRKHSHFYLKRGNKIRHFEKQLHSDELIATLDEVTCKALHCLNDDLHLTYWSLEATPHWEEIDERSRKLLLC